MLASAIKLPNCIPGVASPASQLVNESLKIHPAFNGINSDYARQSIWVTRWTLDVGHHPSTWFVLKLNPTPCQTSAVWITKSGVVRNCQFCVTSELFHENCTVCEKLEKDVKNRLSSWRVNSAGYGSLRRCHISMLILDLTLLVLCVMWD